MKRLIIGIQTIAFLLLAAAAAPAEVKVEVGYNDLEHATPEFKFKEVPSPAKDTAASAAKISIVAGVKDGNCRGVDVLNDGKLPTEEDQPAANFFFGAGTEGGRLLIDLGSVINVKQVRTYSWHVEARGPQVYTLYAADGTAAGFNDKPGKDVDPQKAGWKLIAKVDTRPKAGAGGGQYGVCISDAKGPLGKYRYLLIAAFRTESEDPFGNTFYSEINVIDADKPAPPPAIAPGSVKVSNQLALSMAERAAQSNLESLKVLMQELGVNADAAKRAEIRKKAEGLLEPLDKKLAEIAKLVPADAKWRVDQLTAVADPIRVALGDKATLERLQKQAESKTPKEAAFAKAVLARAQFMTAGKDAAVQGKALDAFEAALKADRKSDEIAKYMVQSHDEKTTPPAVADRIEKILKEVGDSDTAEFAVEDWTCARKLASLTGNPLVIKMLKVDDTAFSTDSFKGKVILVDIWATWCGPCVRELPHVVKVYQKYKDQGLEIVGVSCDSKEDLKKFIDSHKEITWTLVYDPKLPKWDTAKQFGVLSIPRMFLIDKRGVVRTIEAREKMEEMIPKLLAE